MLRSLEIFILFFLCVLAVHSDLTCNPHQSQDYLIGLCKCSPFNSIVNFDCMSCQVGNCQLCSVGNPNECDIYQLTQTICVPHTNSTPICTSPNCLCTLDQININGSCQKCLVSNCRLCSANNQNQCDICLDGYVLDQLTLSQCVPHTNSTLDCIDGSCYCAPYDLNINGSCVHCLVENCLLCSATNSNECDICKLNFILDHLTYSNCLPSHNSTLNCDSSICSCSPFDLSVNGVCYSCDSKNCLLCNPKNRTQCDVCKSEYILDKLTLKSCVLKEQTQKLLCNSLACECSPFQSKVNGQCLSCNITNCILCEIGNQNQCQICKQGYVLDKLTQLNCIQINNNEALKCTNNCTASKDKNGCTAFQVNVQGVCVSCTVTNCLLCSIGNANECDVCKSGYILDKLTQSICVLPNHSTPVCTAASCKCTSPFQINNNGTCSLCAVSNCRLCSAMNPNECDICSDGYKLDKLSQTICVSLAHQNSSLTCTSANGLCSCSPFTVSNNSLCVQCAAQNCLLCSVANANECDICKQGYRFNTTTKKCARPRCSQSGKIWDSETKKCTCPPSSYLKLDSTCQKCPEHCQQCSQQQICSQCIPFYHLTVNNTCQKCMPHCRTCTNSTGCLQCSPGFYFNPTSKMCVGLSLDISSLSWLILKGQTLYFSCPQSCASCSTPYNCNECKNGHYLNGNKCKSCPQVCMTCDPNSPSTCLSCYPGFTLASKTCKKCTDNNCQTCTGSPDYCSLCNSGYYATQTGICQSCGDNCISCNMNGACQNCSDRYTLVDGYCQQCMIGCDLCDSNNIQNCLNCAYGLYKDNNGICTLCPTGCQECSNSTMCSVCRIGYRLENNMCYSTCQFPCFQCSINYNLVECTKCMAGYKMDSKTSSCVADLQCNNIANGTSNCSVCPNLYALNANKCVACQIANDPMCINCAADLVSCSLCKSGYYLGSTNKCQSCAIGCLSCESVELCNVCSDGFYMLKDENKNNLGVCQQCNPNLGCATCQSDSTCLSCRSGFSLKGSKCLSDRNIRIKMTLLYELGKFSPKLRGFKRELLNLLGDEFSGKQHLFSILSLKSGSVIVDSQLSIPSSSDPSSVYNTLTQKLSSSSTLNGISLGQSPEITANGFQTQTSEATNTNAKIIVGICVPIAVICIVGIIVIAYRFKNQSKLNAYQDNPKPSDENNPKPGGAAQSAAQFHMSEKFDQIVEMGRTPYNAQSPAKNDQKFYSHY